MPCRDSWSPEDYLREKQARLDNVTALLCDACGTIEVLDGPMSVELRKWWTRHKAEDAAREAHERQVEKREALRKSVMSKLTPDERLALGLPAGGA